MRVNPKLKIILTSLVLTVNMSAQGLSDILFPQKNISYLGQCGTNGKERNGMGCLKIKDGSIYAGDFSRNQFHGTGIYISPQNKPINRCGDGVIYVGRWFRGKKEGTGKLYDANGNLIYNGKFSEDAPIGKTGVLSTATDRFSIIDIDDEIYIGEISNNLPNGFGIYHDKEGFFTLCPSREGRKHGVGIMLLPPTEWSVFTIENDLYYPIANSGEQREIYASYKANRDRDRAELLNTFSSLLTEGTQLISDINNLTSNTSVNNDYSKPHAEAGEKEPNNSIAGQSNKYNMSEQQSYNSDKSTYSRYDSMLAQVFAGNRNASTNEIESWQNKMKQLRKKWEAKGKSFPHSANEDR